MKDLNKLFKDCLTDVRNAGITIGNIASVTINTRAKHRWGQCKYNCYTNNYSININEKLLEDTTSDIATKNTIIHEILHTCKNAMNHKSEWQRLANIINTTYPQYTIQRTTSAEEKGVDAAPVRANKYEAVCQTCGHTYYYKRWTKVCANPSNYRCGHCKTGKLKINCLDNNTKIYSIH